MKIEYLNEGNALPPGHPHAGKIGVAIDNEDGSTPQRVYAPTKDELVVKMGTMYASTKTRLTEVKSELDTVRKPAMPATPPADPGTAAERRMQLTSELADPARSGKAVIEILKEEGIDLAGEKEERARNAELARLRQCATEFQENNPEYTPGPWGRLISDRAFSMYGEITTETLQKSFDALREGGMLPSGALEHTDDPGAPDDLSGHRPSAEPPPPPRTPATGMRPSQFGGGSRRAEPATPKLTYEKVLEIAGTDEYERRLREEPGFLDQVNTAVADFERRSKRAG